MGNSGRMYQQACQLGDRQYIFKIEQRRMQGNQKYMRLNAKSQGWDIQNASMSFVRVRVDESWGITCI